MSSPSPSSPCPHDVSSPVRTEHKKVPLGSSPTRSSPKGVMDIKSFVDLDVGVCDGRGNKNEVVDIGHRHIIKAPALGVVDSTLVLDVEEREKVEDETGSKQNGIEVVEDSSLQAPAPASMMGVSSRPYVCHCTIRPTDEILDPILRTVLEQGHPCGYQLLNRAFKDMFDDVFVKQLNLKAQGCSHHSHNNSLLYIGDEKDMACDGGRDSRGYGRVAVISCQEEETSSFQDWIVITPDQETTNDLLVMLRTHGMVATKVVQ